MLHIQLRYVTLKKVNKPRYHQIFILEKLIFEYITKINFFIQINI